MRYHRTTGLMLSQMQELVYRVQVALINPSKSGSGRPKACGLYAAVEIAYMYLRQNCTQEFVGDMRGISQPTVSRIVSALAPVVKAALEEFVPEAAGAIAMVKGRVCLVDGTITPCWSYEDRDELWSRKHGTTGFNAQLLCLLDGTAIYISDPLPGKRTTPGHSRRRRPRRSSGILAVVSLTRDIKAAEWSRRARSRSTASWLRRTSRWWRGLEVASHAVAPARRTEATHRLT